MLTVGTSISILYSIQCAVSGVMYLESMLSVRLPLVLDEHKNVGVRDNDMVHLLKEGLYSCSHGRTLFVNELCNHKRTR